MPRTGGTDMVARGHHAAERRLLPPRRSDIERRIGERRMELISLDEERRDRQQLDRRLPPDRRQLTDRRHTDATRDRRSEEHTSELQSRLHLVCRLLLEKKKAT